MAENIIKELIVNVHELSPAVAAGVYKELAKTVGDKSQTISEAVIKWSVNNLVTRVLSEIAIKNLNEGHDLETVMKRSLLFLESVLLPYTTENEKDLLPRVVQFIECVKDVMKMDAEKKPMQDLEKRVADFLNA